MAKKINKKKIKQSMTSLEKEQNKQLIVFFAIILIFLGGLIVGYLYFQSLNRFNYVGVDFQREKEGEIVFYHGKFPVNYLGKTEKVFNLYLRLDPRKNKVPIDANFSLANEIVVSFEPGLEKCDKAIVGQSTLAQFVSIFPWVKQVSGAVSNRSYAEEMNIDFADCSSATRDKTVILARFSESSSIEQEGENCYILNVGSCDYLALTERYIIGVIAQINEKKL